MGDQREPMGEQKWCYVAADPSQPGAAWACVVDVPEDRSRNASTIAGWIRRGARVERVTVEAARKMLGRWQRPEKHTGQAYIVGRTE